MSTIAGTTPATVTDALPSATITAPELYRFSVEQYERMAELGYLDDPKVELIDGLLVKKMTSPPTHTLVVSRVRRKLEDLLTSGWHVREEKPVRIPDHDEPEPDLAVTKGDIEDYPDRNPGQGDVTLVVEVAETSLRRDRGEKLRAYARGGIPEYWIVNLVDRSVERHSAPDPQKATYTSRQVHGPEDSVPVLVQGVEVGRIRVGEILP